MKWTSSDVLDALREALGVCVDNLGMEEWALLTEVPLRAPRAGYEQGGESYWSNTRTIDALAVRCWSSGAGFQRLAFEVKVSRADYRNETRLKRAPAERAAHRTYYVAPAGIIPVDELPDGWGLVEVYEHAVDAVSGPGRLFMGSQRCKAVRKAVPRSPGCDMDYLVAAHARRASRAEERIRTGADDAAEIPALRAEVTSLTGKLDRRDSAVMVEKNRVRSLRSLLAAVDGMNECADCGHPVAYLPARGVWRHKDKAQEQTCATARQEADRLAKEAKFGARYLAGWPGPVEPKALRAQAADIEDPDSY